MLSLILALVFVAGSILGVLSFLKVRNLERELKKTRLEFSNFLVEQEITEGDEGAVLAKSVQLPEVQLSEKISVDVPDENGAVEDAPIAAKEEIQNAVGEGQATPADRNLEETIGSLWAVWVGGIALALGAVFLVKYSIERGLLSPGVRIMLGLGFSSALVMAGEWGRRREQAFSFPGFAKANIPAILTAAGTMGLFATIFAAYELYNMLPPVIAFIALGAVAVATTFAALLHGPLLATLGILASFIAPLLVSTDSPSVPGLSTYILAVSASGFVVGRLRLWKWLAVAAACGLIIYGVLILSISNFADRLFVSTYMIAAWAMIAYVFFVSLYQKSANHLEKHDYTGVTLLGLMLSLFLGITVFYKGDFLSDILLLLIVILPMALAFFYSSARILVYVAMAVATLGYLGWSIIIDPQPEFGTLNDIEALLTNFQVRNGLAGFAWLGIAMAGAALGISLYALPKSSTRSALAVGGAFLPLLLLSVNYIRVSNFSSSWSYSFVALLIFAGFLFISNAIYQRLDEEEPGRDGASAAYSVAAFVALALCASLILERAALTIALALLVPAIAFVYYRRPLPALRALSVFAAGLWIGRILWDPAIVGDDLGTTPVFNWLTYGYGIPTLGFAMAVWFIGQTKRDKWLEALEAIALVSFIATLGLVALHAINPAQVFTIIDTLEEAALVTIIGAGVALGLLNIRRTASSAVLRQAVMVLGYGGMVAAAIGLLFAFNPMITSDRFGDGLLFNGLLFAYVVPGVLYLLLGWKAKGKRADIYVNSAFVLGSLLLAAWVNLTIRHVFHVEGLNRGPTSESELYTYSIVWLIIGIIVLSIGIYMRTKLVRLVSVGILMMVVAKVFLIDMAGLEGFLRALSFIGLGATLIAIGLVYQRVLSKPDTEQSES